MNQTPYTNTFSKAGVAFEVAEQGTIRIGGLNAYTPGAELKMEDQFAVSTLAQSDGQWKRHSIESSIPDWAEGKRRVIPITIPYDDPDLALQSRLTAYDQGQQRVVCRGTTEGSARRREGENTIDVPCEGPAQCKFAQGAGIKCQWFGRLRVHIDVAGVEPDPCKVFVLRSAGFNTLRGVEAALRQYHQAFKGKLRGVKFNLTMHAATTATSDWSAFEFIGLTLNGLSMVQAAKAANAVAAEAEEAGIDYAALDNCVRAGIDNSEFSNKNLEGLLASEFFPVQAAAVNVSPVSASPAAAGWTIPGLFVACAH